MTIDLRTLRVEHLGGVVYDGIWVGEHSKVPNVDGIRKSLVDELRKIKPPVVRFHSLFIAHEDKFAVTPNFHVFAMYAAHQGAQSVRTAFSSPSIAFARDGRAQALWGLGGSASLREKELTVTVVNPHATDARECAIVLKGATVKDGRASVLSSTDLRAHNSFKHPALLAPRDSAITPRAGSLVHTFPAASVTRLQLSLE